MHWWLSPEVCDGPVMERGRVNEVVVGLWEGSLLLGCRELLRQGQMLELQGWGYWWGSGCGERKGKGGGGKGWCGNCGMWAMGLGIGTVCGHGFGARLPAKCGGGGCGGCWSGSCDKNGCCCALACGCW